MPGGGVLHLASVRYRVVGSGNLQSKVYGLDPTTWNQTLANVVMADPMNREPTRLANFANQGIKLEIFVDQINEWFKFNTIMANIKEIYPTIPEEL